MSGSGAEDGLSVTDERWLRRAFALAVDARAAGFRPFGAVIVAGDRVFAETGSNQGVGGDPTGHAEMNAIRMAQRVAAPGELASATLYASSESCAMCAAAAFYAGIGRIVFGLGENRLRAMRNATARGAGVGLSARDVLSRTTAAPVLIGPSLEKEALTIHGDFWAGAVV